MLATISEVVPIDLPTLLELLVISGIFTAIGETFRWFTGRGKARVDNASLVQGMAIDLLKPLHTELDLCNTKLHNLSLELDSVLGYAIIAHALLETPPVKEAVLASGRSLPVPPASVLRR
jgi:hypothetical protein